MATLIAADGPVAVTEPVVMEVLAENRQIKNFPECIHLPIGCLLSSPSKIERAIRLEIDGGKLRLRLDRDEHLVEYRSRSEPSPGDICHRQ